MSDLLVRLLMVPGDLPDLRTLFRRPDWFDYAACRDQDRDLFYPASGQSAKMRAAKAICDECVVRHACAVYAMNTEMGEGEHGVWGGLSPRERRAVRAGYLTLDQALEAARAEVRQEQNGSLSAHAPGQRSVVTGHPYDEQSCGLKRRTLGPSAKRGSLR